MDNIMETWVDEGRLFDFEWPVDQYGYAAETITPDPTKRVALLGNEEREVIRRKDGPLRFYRPLAEFPGLAREFSETSEDGYLDFAQRYGLLGMGLDATPDDCEDLYQWRERQQIIRSILIARDGEDAKEAIRLYNETNHFIRTFIRTEETRKARIVVRPLTLFGAMLLQVADELTTGIKFKRCRNCFIWFKYRANKDFCSSKCRYAHSNKRRNS
jgi:hypothetical protein